VIDSFRCTNGYETDNHELLLLEDGHALIIGRDYRQVDMRQYVPDGDSNATVIGNIVQELDRDGQVAFHTPKGKVILGAPAVRPGQAKPLRDQRELPTPQRPRGQPRWKFDRDIPWEVEAMAWEALDSG
jgi:hypothetical protein